MALEPSAKARGVVMCDVKTLHLRVMALERDLPKQIAICRDCSTKTAKKLDAIANEIGRFGEWAANAEKKIKRIVRGSRKCRR